MIIRFDLPKGSLLRNIVRTSYDVLNTGLY